MDEEREERSELERVATELSFEVDDSVIEMVAESVDGMRSHVEKMVERGDRNESIGRMSDDEYDALLDVYEEPRTTGTDGPLSGLTFAIKDLLMVKDLEMTCGLADFHFVPSVDATVVERILQAGGAVVGKANTDAYAFGPTGEYSELGHVKNPAAEGHIPGGSSSGSGAAVAGGLVDAAIGTDAGGSARIPAACCGLVCAKPTQSLVSRFGLIGLAPSLSTIAPMTRNVETAARIMDTIMGRDLRDSTTTRYDIGSVVEHLDEPGELTIGVPTSFLAASSDAVRSGFNQLIDELSTVDTVTINRLDTDLTWISDYYPFIIAAEVAWLIREHNVMRGIGTGYSLEWHEAYERLKETGFNDHIASRILPIAYYDEITDGRTYVAAREKGLEFKRQLNDLWEEADVLLTPTMRVLPPETSDDIDGSAISGNTSPFNLADTPAVCVPFGSSGSLPMSAQIVAPSYEDDRALGAAKLVEQVVDGL